MEPGSLADRLRTRSGIALVLGAVALAAVLLYLPTIDYDFVWDDTSLISENDLLAQSEPWEFFSRGFWAGTPDPPEGTAQAFYRPLTILSFWFDLKLAGLNPGYFHLINTILGALAAVAVGLVIWELLRSGVWAGLGALLFAAHSSHVESTAFISGRTDLLLTLFLCIATFALLRSLRKRNSWWLLPVPIGFALALLSKETAILFPVLVGLAPLLSQTRYYRGYWLLIGVTLLIAVGYFFLHTHLVGAALPGLALGSAFNRYIEVANTFGLYVRMFFWPFAHQVKFPAVSGSAGLTSNAIIALLFIVTLPLLAIRRRFWVSLLGYAWTILFLLPVILIPIGPQAAERLLYLPSAGLVIIVITLLSRLLHRRIVIRKLAGTMLGLVSIAFGADTAIRSAVWHNEANLFSAMATEAPAAPSAFANLANVVRFEHPDSAVRLYRKALALDPKHVRAHINAGILLSQQGDHDQALHHLCIANQLRPGSAQVLNNLGLAFIANEEPESALVYLGQAVSIEPNSAPVRLNHAIALAKAGLMARADSEIHQALTGDPRYVPARLALIERFEKRGLLDSAASQMEQVTTLDPNRPTHFNRFGTILVRLGDSARAQQYYLRAISLDPDFVPALFNQAILYAAQGDTQAAIRLASSARRLRPDLTAVQELYGQLTGPE